MEKAPGKAKLVDATPTDPSEAITATLPRSEIEEAIRTKGGPAPLVLDIQRVRNGGRQDDVEAHTLEIEWEKQDLEELLRKTEGEEVSLTFDRSELEQALETDVEGHGIRSTAAVLSVAAVTSAAFAGQASARVLGIEGGTATGTPATEVVSDAASGGGYTAAASSTDVVSDAASGGGYAAASSEGTELISDAASGGGYATPAGSELISDAASGGGYAPSTSGTELISDAASGGGYAPSSSDALVSDAASGGGYEPSTASAASGGGTSISAPSPATTAGIAGGVALLITGAGFAVRGRRRGPGPQPA